MKELVMNVKSGLVHGVRKDDSATLCGCSRKVYMAVVSPRLWRYPPPWKKEITCLNCLRRDND